MKYDVLIVGAGPGGIFAAYELMNNDPEKKIAVFEAGHPLEKRKCPIDGKKVKSCIHCKTCAIMKGFGGAGAFSDGKYNITNQFGGTLYQHIGKDTATELMEYVDKLNLMHGGEGTKLYSTTNSEIRKLCLQNGLHLLDASVRHLGTDINYVVLQNLYEKMKAHVDFYFDASVDKVEKTEDGYAVVVGDERYEGTYCIISAGRSGSKWMEQICHNLEIPTNSSRVDIGVRVELPAEVFAPITDELYESTIIRRIPPDFSSDKNSMISSRFFSFASLPRYTSTHSSFLMPSLSLIISLELSASPINCSSSMPLGMTYSGAETL